ncbi:ATP-dependent DNA helicase [Plakobranchus ocellatus]|uniref:ATP-dependent DNA helicase n=1 Tax=Plakobranchus ocellatus TaxID=259542 RepID=A0AAV4BWG1_9GAST|nr:ATP-dependent DNA helicase [Plakobranchus ocellatus]
MGDCKGAGQNPMDLLCRATDATMFTPDCSATIISQWTPTIALTGSLETVLATSVALIEVVKEDVADYIVLRETPKPDQIETSTMPRKRRYPCSLCGTSCNSTCSSVECNKCKGWIHRRCIALTDKQLEAWDENALTFVCRVCAFEGGKFSSHKALERLKRAAASTDVEILIDAARSEKFLMEIYGVQLLDTESEAEQSHQIADDQVNSIALQVLSKYHPVIMETHAPLCVTSDGNCLFRAVSLALYGTEEFHASLRVLCAIEMIENRAHYDYEYSLFVDHFNDPRLVFDKYDVLLKDVTKIGSFSGLMTVSAISAALNLPIQSYCPPTQAAYFLNEPLSREVRGRGVTERQKSISF